MAQDSILLERKLSRCSTLNGIGCFLLSSNAKIPQSICLQFTAKFLQLLNRAMECADFSGTAILVHALQHIVDQNQTSSIQNLITSRIHSNFQVMLKFFAAIISDKGNPNHSDADEQFLRLLNTIVNYCEKMHDHFKWFVKNILRLVLMILGETDVSVHVRTQTGRIFLGIYEKKGLNAAVSLRPFVEENKDDLAVLSESVLDRFAQTGHYELQELIMEIIFRMWKTEIRNRKALTWFRGYPRIAAKFRAIRYGEYDYGVRTFLNELNSSVRNQRIVTFQYDKFVIGEKTYLPTNRWCNCADFCLVSEVLGVRYPFHEEGSKNEHKCLWSVAHIRADDVASFKIIKGRSGTYYLRLNFHLPAYHVLQGFPLPKDEVSRELVMTMDVQEKLNLRKLVIMANTLFGATKNLGHVVSKSTVPKVNITGNHGAWNSDYYVQPLDTPHASERDLVPVKRRALCSSSDETTPAKSPKVELSRTLVTSDDSEQTHEKREN